MELDGPADQLLEVQAAPPLGAIPPPGVLGRGCIPRRVVWCRIVLEMRWGCEGVAVAEEWLQRVD